MSDSDVVIRVEGLGKKYSLHHEQSEPYTALRDVMVGQFKAAGRLLNPFTLVGQLQKLRRHVAQETAASEEQFWALKDVNFEIHRGERVGIIGRNGAGKSTLLKILSRITEPTTGRVEICGRVASLLEVGTGFHPELTGRENIYLNGAILGMTRREIRSRFHEIVEFAEIDRFLDTPVKRYSSGMYVRLAFAVAAHLEPEILVVDEVLAVGDSGFQKKCIKKMSEASFDSDRTVLFVSHSMSAISKLCQNSILLDDGRLMLYGSTEKVIKEYLMVGSSGACVEYEVSLGRSLASVRSAKIVNSHGECQKEFLIGDQLALDLLVNIRQARSFKIQASFIVQKSDGTNIYHCKSIDSQAGYWELDEGTHAIRAIFESIKLYPGTYSIKDLWVADQDGTTLDLRQDSVSFIISQGGRHVQRQLFSHAALVHETPSWKKL